MHRRYPTSASRVRNASLPPGQGSSGVFVLAVAGFVDFGGEDVTVGIPGPVE